MALLCSSASVIHSSARYSANTFASLPSRKPVGRAPVRHFCLAKRLNVLISHCCRFARFSVVSPSPDSTTLCDVLIGYVLNQHHRTCQYSRLSCDSNKRLFRSTIYTVSLSVYSASCKRACRNRDRTPACTIPASTPVTTSFLELREHVGKCPL